MKDGPLPTASRVVGNNNTTEYHPSDTDVATDGRRQPPATDKIGKYELVRQLGQGAFGAVYLARHPELDRLVAIKHLRRHAELSSKEEANFIAEARNAVAVKQPRVVEVYDAGRCDVYGVYIVMEYVEGQTLAQRLQQGTLSVPETVRICLQIAEALAQTHRPGYVHRDLKPANVLLDANGNAKVCDFGLAISETDRRDRRQDFSGTRVYMSPEQLRGHCHLLDGRSDLWSLAVIMYECLTGKRPFRGDSMAEVLEDIETRDPAPMSQSVDVPEELQSLFRRCTRLDPSQRLDSAAEFIKALKQVGQPMPSPVPPGLAPAGTPVRRGLPLGAAALALLVIGLLSWMGWLTLRGLSVAHTEGAVNPLPTASAVPRDPFGTVDLFAKPPRPVVFSHFQKECHYGYMPEARKLRVCAYDWSLFSCGDHAGDMQLDTCVEHGKSPSTTGLFWGLHKVVAADDSIETSCLALVLRPADIALGFRNEARLYSLQIKIHPVIGPMITTHNRCGVPMEVDWNRPVSLRVRIEGGRPTDVSVQGKELERLDKSETIAWEDYAGGECGVSFQQYEATFTRLFQQF
ncbi:MAG: serine/threonine protein kinase [Pirellulales bacterium]